MKHTNSLFSAYMQAIDSRDFFKSVPLLGIVNDLSYLNFFLNLAVIASQSIDSLSLITTIVQKFKNLNYYFLFKELKSKILSLERVLNAG